MADGFFTARRSMSALSTHVRTHIRKEEEIIIPLLERLFTIPELGAQVGRMMASFPPDEMARVVPWLFGRLTPEQRVAYGSMAAAVMPPERVKMFAAWARAGLDDDAYAALTARVPALGPISPAT